MLRKTKLLITGLFMLIGLVLPMASTTFVSAQTTGQNPAQKTPKKKNQTTTKPSTNNTADAGNTTGNNTNDTTGGTGTTDGSSSSGGVGGSSAAKDAICEGIGGCEEKDGEPTVDSTITTAINIFSVIIGVIAVIMIIVGGLKYITSGGEAASLTSAKNTILYALVGLVVVVMAQVIVKFVLNRVTSGSGGSGGSSQTSGGSDSSGNGGTGQGSAPSRTPADNPKQ